MCENDLFVLQIYATTSLKWGRGKGADLGSFENDTLQEKKFNRKEKKMSRVWNPEDKWNVIEALYPSRVLNTSEKPLKLPQLRGGQGNMMTKCNMGQERTSLQAKKIQTKCELP